MPIVAHYTTGQSLYARFDDASNTAVNLTEGSTLKLGRYTAADSAIVTAGLAAGTYSARIFIGTAGTQASGDTLVKEVPEFFWSGSVELLKSVHVATNARIWYVDDGGSDSNDGRTPATPKLTISAAHTAASPGDTIKVGAGTYSGFVSITKNNITLEGDTQSGVLMTHTGPTGNNTCLTVTGNNCTVRRLTITCNTANADVGVVAASTYGFTGEDLTISGSFDGIQIQSSIGCTLRRVYAVGKYDGVNASDVRNFLAESCTLVSSADYSVTSNDFRALHCFQTNDDPYTSAISGRMVGCNFIIKRTNAGSGSTGCLQLSGAWDLEGCHYYAASTSGSAAGAVYAVQDWSNRGRINVRGGQVQLSNSGSGSTYDFITTRTNSEINLYGVGYNSARLSGNVYDRGPTAALVWSNSTKVVDSVTGNVGGNVVGSVASVTAAVTVGANNDKTGYRLSATGVDDVLDEAMAGHTTAGTHGKLLNDLQTNQAQNYTNIILQLSNTHDEAMGAIEAVDDKLGTPAVSVSDDIAAIETGGGGSPVLADVVGNSYTWFGNRFRANNIVEVESGYAGPLALKPDMNPNVTIDTVDSVAITGAATVTASNLSVDRSQTRAQWTVPALNTEGTYSVVVTITTVEAQTITTTCVLKVR